MYNSTNGDAFCEVLVKRRERYSGNSENGSVHTGRNGRIHTHFYVHTNVFHFDRSGMGTDCIRDQNAEKGI